MSIVNTRNLRVNSGIVTWKSGFDFSGSSAMAPPIGLTESENSFTASMRYYMATVWAWSSTEHSPGPAATSSSTSSVEVTAEAAAAAAGGMLLLYLSYLSSWLLMLSLTASSSCVSCLCSTRPSSSTTRRCISRLVAPSSSSSCLSSGCSCHHHRPSPHLTSRLVSPGQGSAPSAAH